MTNDEIGAAFNPLYDDLVDEEDFPSKRPLLAHYTSLAALEQILATDEVLFSNPLVMNDLEEVRFGILRGNELFHSSSSVQAACKTAKRYAALREAYVNYFMQFEGNHAIDTYVFCLSEHDPTDVDGLLSMWRGYGGNGTGAAIVVDTNKLTVTDGSPLIVARVHYGSTEGRNAWLTALIEKFAKLLAASNVPDDRLFIPAYRLFERIKLFALFSKHDGFHEEREWRVAYLPDRDDKGRLTPMLDYSIGSRGAELRLRFKIAPIDAVSDPELSLEKLVDRILLGPTISGILAQRAVIRMLEKVGKAGIAARVQVSSIPFRPS